MNIKTEIIWNRPPEVMKRDFEDSLRDAWMETGDFWHKTYLPMHFQTSAFSRYGYQPRSVKYQRAKHKVKGHGDPLVWSGQLKRLSLNAHITRSTSQGVKVTFAIGARVLNLGGKTMRKNGRPMPPIREELTRITTEELERLKQYLAWRLQQQMAKRQAERMGTKQAA